MPPAETSPVRSPTDDAGADGALVAGAARRADPVHALPALLPHGRRSGGILLHPPEPRRQAGAARLRPLDRVRDRSDREEAAQPFPPGHARAELRHRGLQPRLQVLPELGHLEGEARRAGAAAQHARRGRRSRGRPGRAVDRLHLQRSGHLGRVRHRHRARGAAARRQATSWSPPATSPTRRAPSCTPTPTPPTSTSRRSPRTSIARRRRPTSSRCSRR